ncbi:hypothetical protein EYR15_13435 [Hansschlegelia quercus]|uniref:Uncharacterized protein n=2 Tax=Hansschlegelia quercus TaxID=2528245 RepID=A0A4V2JDF8_9HYPH|nr:hypothetical protein EYR15_13435 [Hansschlegelia quercus]
MAQGMSFRTAITLIVCGYALLAAVLVFGAGHDLWRPVSHYTPQVSWLFPNTTAVRTAALSADGAFGTAGMYALLAAVSLGLIAALAAGGFAWGVLFKSETELGLDKAVSYATILALLYAVGKTTEVLMHALAANMPSGGIQAMPGLWFATLIPSAAILSRLAALVAHDLGVFVVLAVEGEPAALSAFAARSEERRGADSLEAKLARRMTRLRKTA